MIYLIVLVTLVLATAIMNDQRVDISNRVYISVTEANAPKGNGVNENSQPPTKRRKMSSAVPIASKILRMTTRLTKSSAEENSNLK